MQRIYMIFRNERTKSVRKEQMNFAHFRIYFYFRQNLKKRYSSINPDKIILKKTKLCMNILATAHYRCCDLDAKKMVLNMLD